MSLSTRMMCHYGEIQHLEDRPPPFVLLAIRPESSHVMPAPRTAQVTCPTGF